LSGDDICLLEILMDIEDDEANDGEDPVGDALFTFSWGSAGDICSQAIYDFVLFNYDPRNNSDLKRIVMSLQNLTTLYVVPTDGVSIDADEKELLQSRLESFGTKYSDIFHPFLDTVPTWTTQLQTKVREAEKNSLGRVIRVDVALHWWSENQDKLHLLHQPRK
jgi:hypothetical protein